MTGLGDRLKEARMRKGFTLEDLQSITKIQKRYLSGIENEEYSMMPGAFYVRAFIKQYAEAVDLEADEMLSLYKDTTPSISKEVDTTQIASAPLSRRRGLSSSNKLNEVMPKIIVALFIVVILFIAYFLLLKNPSRNAGDDFEKADPQITTIEGNKPVVEKVEDEEVEEPIVEDVVEPEVVQTLTFDSAVGETSTYSLASAKEFKLEIRLNGGSWIGIKDNTGKEWMTPARIVNPGETVEYDLTATESIRIRVGRPMSTEIYVNGELLEYGVTPQATVPQNITIEYKKGE